MIPVRTVEYVEYDLPHCNSCNEPFFGTPTDSICIECKNKPKTVTGIAWELSRKWAIKRSVKPRSGTSWKFAMHMAKYYV